MNFHRISLSIVLFALTAFAQATGQPAGPTADQAAASVTIGADETGNWSVDYQFASPQSVLAFARSTNDYREATWTLETEGARFGRVDGIDVIVFDDPARRVDFSIIPLTGQLQDDYTPFVPFADGSLAVHDAQFSLIAFSSLEAVDALNGKIEAASNAALPLDFTVSSDRPIITGATRSDGQQTHRVVGDGAYSYLGNGRPQSFEGFRLLTDASMPDWIKSRYGSDLQGFLASLETLWGFELEKPFTVILAYKGGQSDGLSIEGNALGDELLLEIGGSGFSRASGETLAYLHWYTIREIVELFQTERGVVFGGPETAWIQDGAANNIAYQLIASDMQSGPAFLSSVYTNAFEDCVVTLEGGSLESARARGAVTGPYACGDFIALATDSFLRRRDLFGFWNALIDWAARSGDKTIDKPVYFTTLQLLGATPAQRELLRAIVEDELAQPRKSLSNLLEAAGLEPEFSDAGKLVSLDWPDYAKK